MYNYCLLDLYINVRSKYISSKGYNGHPPPQVVYPLPLPPPPPPVVVMGCIYDRKPRASASRRPRD